MPNWTDNLLIIDGPVENVKAFFTELSSKNNNLAALMPVPDELDKIHQGSREFDGVRVDAWYEDDEGARPVLDIRKDELTEKYGTYKSIDWQYKNWGTKWGDCETEVFTNNEGKKIITFQSAWGPPWKLLHDIAVKYDIIIIDNVQYEFEPGIHIDKYPMTEEHVADNMKVSNNLDKLIKASVDEEYKD
tara:strand:- start:328 stop:894 length:567 start_codon:yes stop_codon:yes gene_type:complete